MPGTLLIIQYSLLYSLYIIHLSASDLTFPDLSLFFSSLSWGKHDCYERVSLSRPNIYVTKKLVRHGEGSKRSSLLIENVPQVELKLLSPTLLLLKFSKGKAYGKNIYLAVL